MVLFWSEMQRVPRLPGCFLLVILSMGKELKKHSFPFVHPRAHPWNKRPRVRPQGRSGIWVPEAPC